MAPMPISISAVAASILQNGLLSGTYGSANSGLTVSASGLRTSRYLDSPVLGKFTNNGSSLASRLFTIGILQMPTDCIFPLTAVEHPKCRMKICRKPPASARTETHRTNSVRSPGATPFQLVCCSILISRSKICLPICGRIRFPLRSSPPNSVGSAAII